MGSQGQIVAIAIVRFGHLRGSGPPKNPQTDDGNPIRQHQPHHRELGQLQAEQKEEKVSEAREWGGWIRRGWIWRFLGAPIFRPEVPKPFKQAFCLGIPLTIQRGNSARMQKKSEKSLEMGSRGPPAPGGRKVRNELKTSKRSRKSQF